MRFKLHMFKQVASFFFANFWTTPLLTLMEKWHFSNFVKVITVVFEKWKDEVSSFKIIQCRHLLLAHLSRTLI